MSLNLKQPASSVNVIEEDLSYTESAASAVLYQSPKGGRKLLWAIVLFIVGMVTWAFYAEVDEFTRGDGRVIPSQSVQMIQNLEGGIVEEVFVREGQVVDKGQLLLRLEDVRFSSTLRESEVNQSQLQARALRLQAEVEGVDYQSILDQSDLSLPSTVTDVERALFQVRQEELIANRQVVEEQRAQKSQELKELKSKSSQLKGSLKLLRQELKLTEPLVKQGAVSQVELLRLRREVNDLSGELKTTNLQIPRITSAMSELEQKLSSVTSAFKSKAQTEFIEANNELSRIQEASQAIVDQVDRTQVKSPVRGTIKQVFAKTLGGVVQPGMDIVAIVPMEDRLLVETRIRPADIAFLHPQQRAMVKFTAYDFSIHGGLEGKVINISPDTIMDEEGQSFYLVQVETDSSYLGTADSPLPIIPGMTVNVDILTGKKTIMDYLLKPILKTKSLALRER